MARVAVITPTYNRGSNGLLEKAILSVAGQTYRDFLHIIVDDGSTDNTAEVVCGYLRRDSRIFHDRRRRDPGQKFGASAAQNHGMRLVLDDPLFSDVEYITFLHSDDMLSRDSLERKVSVMDDTKELLAVFAYTAICDANMRTICIQKTPDVSAPKKTSRRLRRYSCISFPHHTVMLRRDLLNSLAYDENLGSGEDRDFTIRLLDLVGDGRVASIPEVLNFYRVHGDSVTGLYGCEGWHAGDRVYLDHKNCIGWRDRLARVAYTLVTRPHSLLPEPVKKVLRPVRDSVLSGVKGYNIDPFIQSIEGV